MKFCRRSLAGGNIWDSIADLLKIMQLQGVGADYVKEVREIVQHLFTNIVKPARSKRDSRQAKTHVDNLLFQLVDDMLSMWNTDTVARWTSLRQRPVFTKPERKQKSDASPVQFCRRSLAGGNVWDSLADLLKIMKLRGGGTDDVKEVREIVQHLFTNIC